MTGGAGSERTRAQSLGDLPPFSARTSAWRLAHWGLIAPTQANERELAASMDHLADAVVTDLLAIASEAKRCEIDRDEQSLRISDLASRLAKIEAMPDIAQRLEQGNQGASAAGPLDAGTGNRQGSSATPSEPSPSPAPSDEEIVEAIVDAWKSSSRAGYVGLADGARAVLAALRARGSIVK